LYTRLSVSAGSSLSWARSGKLESGSSLVRATFHLRRPTPDWAEELSRDDFVLGQLVGPDPRIEKDDALNHLVNAARRPQVVKLITQFFGNVNSLFVSLWRAGPDSANEKDDDCDGEERLADDEILNDASPAKLVAYSWLDSGAEVVLDPF
jgi:hypothetical protein